MVEKITLWGRKNSSNVQKILWCCDELGVAVERIDAGREFGKVKDDWYLEMNPNGLVPVITVDDFVLWESNAIVRYLSRLKRQGGLVPPGAAGEALAEQWMDWQISALGPAFTPMFHGLVREAPEHRDHRAIERSRTETERLLTMLDRHLQSNRHVAGDGFSFADIPLGIYAYRWSAFEGIARAPLPALEDWYSRLRDRPAFVRHVMVGLA